MVIGLMNGFLNELPTSLNGFDVFEQSLNGRSTTCPTQAGISHFDNVHSDSSSTYPGTTDMSQNAKKKF